MEGKHESNNTINHIILLPSFSYYYFLRNFQLYSETTNDETHRRNTWRSWVPSSILLIPKIGRSVGGVCSIQNFLSHIFLRISKDWNRLDHGSVGRVQGEECLLNFQECLRMFIYAFFCFCCCYCCCFVCFLSKSLCFYHFHFFF